jgi:hypothetical protein
MHDDQQIEIHRRDIGSKLLKCPTKLGLMIRMQNRMPATVILIPRIGRSLFACVFLRSGSNASASAHGLRVFAKDKEAQESSPLHCRRTMQHSIQMALFTLRGGTVLRYE